MAAASYGGLPSAEPCAFLSHSSPTTLFFRRGNKVLGQLSNLFEVTQQIVDQGLLELGPSRPTFGDLSCPRDTEREKPRGQRPGTRGRLCPHRTKQT